MGLLENLDNGGNEQPPVPNENSSSGLTKKQRKLLEKQAKEDAKKRAKLEADEAKRQKKEVKKNKKGNKPLKTATTFVDDGAITTPIDNKMANTITPKLSRKEMKALEKEAKKKSKKSKKGKKKESVADYWESVAENSNKETTFSNDIANQYEDAVDTKKKPSGKIKENRLTDKELKYGKDQIHAQTVPCLDFECLFLRNVTEYNYPDEVQAFRERELDNTLDEPFELGSIIDEHPTIELSNEDDFDVNEYLKTLDGITLDNTEEESLEDITLEEDMTLPLEETDEEFSGDNDLEEVAGLPDDLELDLDLPKEIMEIEPEREELASLDLTKDPTDELELIEEIETLPTMDEIEPLEDLGLVKNMEIDETPLHLGEPEQRKVSQTNITFNKDHLKKYAKEVR